MSDTHGPCVEVTACTLPVHCCFSLLPDECPPVGGALRPLKMCSLCLGHQAARPSVSTDAQLTIVCANTPAAAVWVLGGCEFKLCERCVLRDCSQRPLCTGKMAKTSAPVRLGPPAGEDMACPKWASGLKLINDGHLSPFSWCKHTQACTCTRTAALC